MENEESVWTEMVRPYGIGVTRVGLRCYYETYKEHDSIYSQVSSKLIRDGFIKGYEGEGKTGTINSIGAGYVPKVQKVKYLDNEIIVSEQGKEGCLFSWDDIPGRDNSKQLIDYFVENVDNMKWVKGAEIEKDDVTKTVNIKNIKYRGAHFNLILDGKRNKVFYHYKGDFYECILKEENGKINVYYKSFCEIAGIWEYLPYMRDIFLPLCKENLVYLQALAPPDYNEKPLYYPLIRQIFRNGRIIADKTIFFTPRNGLDSWSPPPNREIKEGKCTQEILERKWQWWDREIPTFEADPSEKHPSFPSKGIHSWCGGGVGGHDVAGCIACEPLYLEEIVSELLKIFLEKGFTVVNVHEAIKITGTTVKIDMSKLKKIIAADIDLEHKAKAYGCKKLVNIDCSTSEVVFRYLDSYNPEIFMLFKNIISQPLNIPHQNRRLIGYLYSFREDEKSWYPIVDIIWFPDGHMEDCTVYASPKWIREKDGVRVEVEYKDTHGFDEKYLKIRKSYR